MKHLNFALTTTVLIFQINQDTSKNEAVHDEKKIKLYKMADEF